MTEPLVDVSKERAKLLNLAPTPVARRLLGGWPDRQSPEELRARTIALLETLSSEFP